MLLLRFAIIELCMKTDKYWKKGKRKKGSLQKRKRKKRKEKNMKKAFNVRLICLSVLELRYLLVGVPVFCFGVKFQSNIRFPSHNEGKRKQVMVSSPHSSITC